MLGYEPHELGIGIEDAVDRVHPDDRAYVQAAMRMHFEGASSATRWSTGYAARTAAYK
ncbi:PAS domain-containing protein [Burkholderia plantarii]|uniref:PAS domain-containing protein n=1 Tax=Burkholderia plantarii TaxID=41899 RepID=UPI001F5B36C8|nr:PAS domain-containing protein [Burkholderia plantarii]